MLLNKTKKIKQIKELQKQNIENNKHDEYMVGVHNGIEISLAILENREPIFVNVLKEPTTTEKVEQIVYGVSQGCIQAGCALVGGETAEMPGMYSDGEYDIAGYTTGVVSKSKIIDGSKVSVGDILLGIESSGVHSNGFSLVRKVVSDANLDLHTVYPELDENKKLGEVLLTPTNIYVKEVLEVIRTIDVHGVAHITGGGFDENIPRILKEGQGIEVKENSFEILPVFKFLEAKGNIPHREMFNIFNMGIGMVLAINEKDVEVAQEILAKYNRKSYVIGHITDEEGVKII